VMQKLLECYCPHVDVTAHCTDSAEGLGLLRAHTPDLLFLDIEMPEMNGFELLDQLEELPHNLVFTTAFDRFAVKAFKYSALDYLLKPIDPSELINVVARAEEKARVDQQQIELLRKQLLQPGSKFQTRIALPYQQGYTIIDTAAILYCESDRCYTRVYLQNGDIFLITKTLGDVEDTLSGGDFFRVHKQFLINLQHVSRYVRGDGGYVVMADGKNLTIARSRKDAFRDIFRHF
jgi:two-component system LytT family response regulator